MLVDAERERRQALLELLRNPTMPSPSICHDTGQLARDLPPHRTLRERLRSLLRRAPTA
jgi:hypothetical protein